MKKIAAMTMVRNDELFLRKWVEYYGRVLGRENIYVYFDGTDQWVPDYCEGANTMVVEHVEGNVAQGDRGRINFLSAEAKKLFGRYDMVIGTDVDEFLVVDPALGVSLPEFLSSVETGCNSISGLGIDVGQKLGEEAPIDWSSSLLSQRSYAKISTRYSKTNTLLKPVRWGSGFHHTRKGNFHIVKDLYLFHFGCVDLAHVMDKMADKGLQASGWSRHLRKRAGTIHLVTGSMALDWSWTEKARRIQNVIRPPYAWNKPAMFEARIVVRIPERFKSLV